MRVGCGFDVHAFGPGDFVMLGGVRIAHTRGLPILRPLFLNYPDEGVTYTLHDEYLVGDDLLVAPVLAPGQATRMLYLPTGAWPRGAARCAAPHRSR